MEKRGWGKEAKKKEKMTVMKRINYYPAGRVPCVIILFFLYLSYGAGKEA